MAQFRKKVRYSKCQITESLNFQTLNSQMPPPMTSLNGLKFLHCGKGTHAYRLDHVPQRPMIQNWTKEKTNEPLFPSSHLQPFPTGQWRMHAHAATIQPFSDRLSVAKQSCWCSSKYLASIADLQTVTKVTPPTSPNKLWSLFSILEWKRTAWSIWMDFSSATSKHGHTWGENVWHWKRELLKEIETSCRFQNSPFAHPIMCAQKLHSHPLGEIWHCVKANHNIISSPSL